MAAKKIDIVDVRQLIQLKIRREQSQLLLHFIDPTQYSKLLCAAIESYGSTYADLLLLSDAGL